MDALIGLTPNHGLQDEAETERGNVMESSALNDGDFDLNNIRDCPAIRKRKERFGLETKIAKLLRQEELRTHAVRSMATCEKRN